MAPLICGLGEIVMMSKVQKKIVYCIGTCTSGH